MPSNLKNFNVDNVRVVKIMGGSLAASRVVQGMVFGREPEGEKKLSWKSSVLTLALLRYYKKDYKGQSRSLYMSFGHFTNGDERDGSHSKCR